MRTPEHDQRIDILISQNLRSKDREKKIVAALKVSCSHLVKSKLNLVRTEALSLELLKYEARHVVAHSKIGILLRKNDQNTEDEMYRNDSNTPAFQEFLEFLGEEVKLNGFKGFRGGLDVGLDTTGKTSFYTKLHNIEIMFHVSTLLPHQEMDEQQVETKRHLGNDIVVIVFNDSTQPFNPSWMTSEFNQVYAVVQPVTTFDAKETRRYRIGFACKYGVPSFGPLLATPAIFEKTNQLRELFITKLLNAECAACTGPAFNSKLRRTRKVLLEDIAKKFGNIKEK